MRVYVDCVGCEQRKMDAQRIVNYFKANGAKIAGSPKDCDHAVLVTCAVDSSNEERSLSRLEDIVRELPEGVKVTIGGCLPSISPGKLTGYPVDGTFSPRSMESLDAKFCMVVPMVDIPRSNRSDFDSKGGEQGKAKLPREDYETAKMGFKVVINEGCLSDCSYCVVKKATGKLRSMAPETILAQIRDGISRGEKTIMLMGSDTGSYGKDIKTSLYCLLRQIRGIPGDFRLFIHDFNVNWLIGNAKEYLDVFSSIDGQRIGGISFPIQSGSDRILALMKRPYRAESAARILKSVRLDAPHIGIGTHIMVGFPSETDDDFASTLDLLEYVGFDFVTCFPYSENTFADSAAIGGKIRPETVGARLDSISSMLGDKVKIIR